MSRATREYTKYSDFNENATHKSSLASLCVFCRDLIIAYDKMDADIKKLIVDESGTYENVRSRERTFSFVEMTRKK